MPQRIRKCIPWKAECISADVQKTDFSLKQIFVFFYSPPTPANNLKTSVLPQAAFNRSQEHPFLQHILYQQHEYTHYFLKEYIKIPDQANKRLICLFHGGFIFYCKTDSTKDRNKTFYNLLTRTSERKAKI